MKGKVYLIGAGPGDPELLTLKALKALKSADVVLHDELVSAEIIALIRSSAREVISVGKRGGRPSISQQEINQLLVKYGLLGLNVIRFKGGDPFIFGRGGEELEAVRQAGIECEIVPGITLIALVSDAPGTRELKELSLAINTPDGLFIVVGCSHSGIDKIVESAAAINPHIHLIAGGFHLVVTPDSDIEKIVTALHDRLKVEYVAPGHCTGEPAFTALKRTFSDHYLYAGLGATLTVSGQQHQERASK